MNKQYKHSGFTMVELLTTIVIIGILSTIGIVTVTNLRAKQEIKHDQTQQELFRQTAKTYFTDNKSQLPYKPMGTKKVTLQQLIDENYIDSLLKYDKEPYDNSSYVTVRLLGNGIYGYTVSLKKDATNIGDKDPKPTEIKYDFKNFINDYETVIHYTNSSNKLIINMSDEDGIAAYKYTIISKKIKKESEYIYVKETKTKSDNIVINPTEYEDGEYKITISVWDTNGYEKTYSGGKHIIFLDTKKPTCEVKANTADKDGLYTIAYTPGKWTNKDVKVTTTCADAGGSGCTYGGSTRTLTTNTNENSNFGTLGTFYDKAGNETICESVNIKIDKSAPKCVSSGGSATWINKNSTNQSITLTGTCTDTGGSGCTGNVTKEISTNINSSSESPGKVYDNAGNEGVCPANQTVKIDKNEPTCTVTGGNATWINKSSTTTSRKITATCSDTGGSGCTKTSFSKTYSDNINTTTAGAIDNNSGGSISDNAGNVVNCLANQTVKIDKNNPTCTNSGGNANWTNSDITLVGTCADTGGSGCTGNAAKSFTTNTNSTTESPGKVYDNAGNSTNCSADQTVKIDKTPPTCTSSGGNTNWTKDSRTLTGTCADTGGSGCTGNISREVTTENKTYFSSTTVSPGTVYDNAGNHTDCPANQTVKIDKKNPTKPTSGTIKFITENNKLKIKVSATGSTDTNQSGFDKYKYVIKANSTKPTKSDFTTTKKKEVASGTTYHVWAVGVDKVGNISAIKKIGKKKSQTCEADTDYGDWGDCTCESGGTCKQYRDVIKTTCNNGTESVSHETESQTCTYPEHAHVWKARGSTKKTSPYTWYNCSRGHSSHKEHYNIYCTECGILKDFSPIYVCPTKPYTEADGWEIVAD